MNSRCFPSLPTIPCLCLGVFLPAVPASALPGVEPPPADEQAQGGIDAPDVRETLRLLAGHPDVKPGLTMTKVAAWAWGMKHVIEEYDEHHLRANLSMDNGRVLLPYAVNYVFKDGLLESFAFEPRDGPPDFEAARRADSSDQPWVLIDRSLLGYSFRIPPAWPLLFEQVLSLDDVKFRFVVLGMTKVHDAKLDEWIENSVQWCIFDRQKPFAKIDEVIAAEEARLSAMGTEVKSKKKTKARHAFVYETTYRGQAYIGKTYYFVSDGQGYAIRFNATKGTYPVNLPKFERFVRGFTLSHERSQDPDLELVRDGDVVIAVVGGAFTEEDAGAAREFHGSRSGQPAGEGAADPAFPPKAGGDPKRNPR